MPIAKKKESTTQGATSARCQPGVAKQQGRALALSRMGSQHGKKRCVPVTVSGASSVIDFEVVPAIMLSRRAPVMVTNAAPTASSSGLDELGAQRKPGSTGDNSKRRKRLEKALQQIEGLKLRRTRGATLDRSMEDKIGRESSIVAELTQAPTMGPTPAPALSCEEFVIVREALVREEARAARAGAVHQKMSFLVDAGKASAKTAETAARPTNAKTAKADEHGCARGAKQRKLERQRELAWLRDESDDD